MTCEDIKRIAKEAGYPEYVMGLASEDAWKQLEKFVDLITKPLYNKLDALLEHCPESECSVCSTIICPHGDDFHFHHDGCPSCEEFESDSENLR